MSHCCISSGSAATGCPMGGSKYAGPLGLEPWTFCMEGMVDIHAGTMNRYTMEALRLKHLLNIS